MKKKREIINNLTIINQFLRREKKATKTPHSKSEIISLLKQHYGFDAGTKAKCADGFKNFIKLYNLKKTKRIPSNDFLSSYEWRSLRYECLKKSGGRCELCGAGKKEGVILHVDHIKPRRKYPELALDVTNLQVLCELCNHGKGNWDETDWRK